MELLNRIQKYGLTALLLILVAGFTGCQPAAQTDEIAGRWPWQQTESPASPQSGEPNLFAAENGNLFFTWTDEEADNEHALRFSNWEANDGPAALTIAQDSGWFVNRSEPFTWHRDRIPAEHGFVTMLPVQDEKMFAVWLDGPATAALGNQVAVAGYTAAEEKPKVQRVLSGNNGADFGQALRLDHGNPSGRVDIIYLDDKHLMVSRMEINDKSADIRAVVVSKSGEILSDRVLVATAASLSSGFPIMEKAGDQVFLAWTKVGEEQSQVKTAHLSVNKILEII